MDRPQTPAAETEPRHLTAPILGDGFELVVVPHHVLRAIGGAADGPGAERSAVHWPGLGPVPEELASTMPATRRLLQIEADPGLAGWLVRGIVVADADSPTGRRLAGHLGGHDRPDDRGMVEIGYTIATPDRGRGLATAAARAWFAWAGALGATTAQLSIEPGNAPSVAVARHLGLAEAERVWDDDDQVWEIVFTGPLPLAEPEPARLPRS